VLDGGDHAGDELEEEEETVLDAGFAPVALNLFNHFLHHRGVVARVNAKLITRKLRVRLEGDGLARVVRHDVLKHLVLREQVAILGVAL
jgi:hypothetical protein